MAGEDVVIGGDIILTAQGIQVFQPADLAKIREALAKVPPGQEMSVTVLRSGRPLELMARRPK